MTIKTEETSEDSTISVETATEASTATHDQFSAGGIAFGRTLGTSGDIESLMIPLGALTMTIKTEETSEDSTISVETATEATTATHDQFSAGGIDFGWTLGTSGDIESLMIPLGAPLLELLEPPAFLLENTTTSYKSSFSIPAGERDTMKIKYWLDVYQLLSMRQLICRATYSEDNLGVKYAYTCAHEGCSGCLTLTHSSMNGILQGHRLIPQDQELFEHTCSPHCQWGSAGSLLSEFKPQGFVLSPALRFAIVAQFLYQQERDDLFLKLLDENTSEGLRLQMNRKLGLEVTQGQWKESLQSFYGKFLFQRNDRRDVNELAPYHFWMLYNSNKKMGDPFWFGTKVRDTDTARVRWLKRIYLWTAFPVLIILQCVCIIVCIYVFIAIEFVVVVLCLPCLCYYGHKQYSRYDREGVEVPGYVSDRWVVQSDNGITCNMIVTYFEKDGTMINKRYTENDRRPYEEGESVPILVLPDTPGSGFPKRMIQPSIGPYLDPPEDQKEEFIAMLIGALMRRYVNPVVR
jgi:hypothetical protein